MIIKKLLLSTLLLISIFNKTFTLEATATLTEEELQLQRYLSSLEKTKDYLLESLLEMKTTDELNQEKARLNNLSTSYTNSMNRSNNENEKIFFQLYLEFIDQVLLSIDRLIARIETIATFTLRAELENALVDDQAKAGGLSQSLDKVDQTEGSFIVQTIIPLIQKKLSAMAEQLQKWLASLEKTKNYSLESLLEMKTIDELNQEKTRLNDLSASYTNSMNRASNENEKIFFQLYLEFIDQVLLTIDRLITKIKTIATLTLRAELENALVDDQAKAGGLSKSSDKVNQTEGSFITQTIIPLIQKKLSAMAEQLQKWLASLERTKDYSLESLLEMKTIDELNQEKTRLNDLSASYTNSMNRASNENEKIFFQLYLEFIDQVLLTIDRLIEKIETIATLTLRTKLESSLVNSQAEADNLSKSSDKVDQTEGSFIIQTIIPLIQERLTALKAEEDALSEQLKIELASVNRSTNDLLDGLLVMKTVDSLNLEKTRLSKLSTTHKNSISQMTDENERVVTEYLVSSIDQVLSLINQLIERLENINALKLRVELEDALIAAQTEANNLSQASNKISQTEGSFITQTIIPLIQEKLIALKAENDARAEQLQVELALIDKSANEWLAGLLGMKTVDSLNPEKTRLNILSTTHKNSISTMTDENERVVTEYLVSSIDQVLSLINQLIERLENINALNLRVELENALVAAQTEADGLSQFSNKLDQTEGSFITQTIIPFIQEKLIALKAEDDAHAEQLQVELALIDKSANEWLAGLLGMKTVDSLNLEKTQLSKLSTTYENSIPEMTDENREIIRQYLINSIDQVLSLIDQLIERFENINALNLRVELENALVAAQTEADNLSQYSNKLDQTEGSFIAQTIIPLIQEKLTAIETEENTLSEQLVLQKQSQDLFKQNTVSTVDMLILNNQLTQLKTQHVQLKAVIASDSTEQTLIINQIAFLEYMIELIPEIIKKIKTVEETESISDLIQQFETQLETLNNEYAAISNIAEKEKTMDQINILKMLIPLAYQNQAVQDELKKQILEQQEAQKKQQDILYEQIMSTEDQEQLQSMLEDLKKKKVTLETKILQETDEATLSLDNDQLLFLNNMIDLINQKLNILVTMKDNRNKEKAISDQQTLWQEQAQSTNKEQLNTLLETLQNKKESLNNLLASADETEQISINDQIIFIDDLIKIITDKIKAIENQEEIDAEKIRLDEASKEEILQVQNEQEMIRKQIESLATKEELTSQKRGLEQQLFTLEQESVSADSEHQKEVLSLKIHFVKEMIDFISKRLEEVQQRESEKLSLDTMNEYDLTKKLNDLNREYFILQDDYAITENAYTSGKMKHVDFLRQIINEKLIILAQIKTLSQEEQAALIEIKNDRYINLAEEQSEIENLKNSTEVNDKTEEINGKLTILNSLKLKILDPQYQLQIDQQTSLAKDLFPMINKKLQDIIKAGTLEPETILGSSNKYIATGTIINMQNSTQTIEEQNLLNQIIQLDKEIADVQKMLENVLAGTPYEKNLYDRFTLLLKTRETYVKQIIDFRSKNSSKASPSVSTSLDSSISILDNTSILDDDDNDDDDDDDLIISRRTSSRSLSNNENNNSNIRGYSEISRESPTFSQSNNQSTFSSNQISPSQNISSSNYIKPAAATTINNTFSSSSLTPETSSTNENSPATQVITSPAPPTGITTDTTISGINSTNQPVVEPKISEAKQQIDMVKKFTNQFLQNMMALQTFHTNEAVRLQSKLSGISPTSPEYIEIAKEYNQHVEKVTYYQQAIQAKMQQQAATPEPTL